ncbi:hypothetical protein [Rhodococcus qingshengii]|nr:hypothetical protein [Rhodococcus qingshengii]
MARVMRGLRVEGDDHHRWTGDSHRPRSDGGMEEGHRNARRFVVNVRLPGAVGQFFRDGSNLVPDNRFGTITFDRWLADTATAAR